MPPVLADALLWLIQILPFVGAAIVSYRMVQALRRGEVVAGKGGRRHESRASSPGWFWFEMALHLVVAVFLFLIGLSFTDLEPEWLARAMRNL